MNIDVLLVGILVVGLGRGTRSVLMAMPMRVHEVAVSQDGNQRALDHRVRKHQPKHRIHLQDFVARIARRREDLLAPITDVVVHILGQTGLQDQIALGQIPPHLLVGQSVKKVVGVHVAWIMAGLKFSRLPAPAR